MKRNTGLMIAAALGVVGFATHASTQPDKPNELIVTAPAGDPLVEQGKYIATLGDCEACHTAPGGQPFAGGVALAVIGAPIMVRTGAGS